MRAKRDERKAFWRIIISNLLALTSLAAAQPAQMDAPQPAIWAELRNQGRVHIDDGDLQGLVESDTVQFRGVPYAAPPLGALRFAPPEPVDAWSGIRDSTKFGTICPQGNEFNEDCLYLNVTIPRSIDTRRPLPVMVWLHGGGLSAGTPNTYDAKRLVTEGRVIFVGVEFRLNVFGFFGLRGLKDSGTFGFQDQQAALRWVRRNISAFAGDARNVTVFGESGGGISTCAQLVSPLASGLIDKAILQSGSCSLSWPKNGPALGQPAGAFFEPLETIQTRGVEAAAELGCSAEDPAVELECLRNLPADRLARVAGKFYAAAYGTPLIPIMPAKALEWGVYNKIPVITGHTRNESRAVASAFELTGHPITNDGYPSLLLDAFGEGTDVVLEHYPLASYGSGALAWSAVYTDRMFACPQLRDARQLARRVPTFVYEFADPHGIGLIPFLPDLPSGASHSSELPLLFDLADGPIDIATGKKIPLSDEQKALARQMIGYWTQFARTGNPNFSGALRWPPYVAHDQADAAVLAPGNPMLTLSNTAAEHQCGFWGRFVERGFDSRRQ